MFQIDGTIDLTQQTHGRQGHTSGKKHQISQGSRLQLLAIICQKKEDTYELFFLVLWNSPIVSQFESDSFSKSYWEVINADCMILSMLFADRFCEITDKCPKSEANQLFFGQVTATKCELSKMLSERTTASACEIFSMLITWTCQRFKIFLSKKSSDWKTHWWWPAANETAR